MTPIKNDNDYRRGYEFLSILTEGLNAGGFGKPDRIRSEIEDAKRELRRWAHRDTAVDVGMGFMVERRIVKDNGMDGYVELVSIPEVFDTLDDVGDLAGAETFFKEFLEIQYRPSMYDCTGQAFTSWYKIFRRGGQFWAYHSVCFDV